MNYYPEFAALLNQYLRHADDRSAAWLARKLQLHPSTVAKWLNGESRPRRPEVVIQLADIFQVYDPAERQRLLEAAGYGYRAQGEKSVSPPTPSAQTPMCEPETAKNALPPGPAAPITPWSHYLSLLVSLLGGLSLLYTILIYRKRVVE